MVYPYGFRIADKEIIDILKKAKKHGVVDIPKHISVGKVGQLLHPIRKDINIFNDRRNRESALRIKKRVTVEIKKFDHAKGWYVKFLKMF